MVIAESSIKNNIGIELNCTEIVVLSLVSLISLKATTKFPFALRIPSVARETYYSVDNNVKWWMNATLTVKGRPSIQTEMREILVAKQETVPQSPSMISKEVVREIVLIPCTYCGSLMPQTSIFCPHCGARRRA